ncbi:hypothetical protein WDW89_16195 [Deltaproteobacteria bacterium TL4]
MNLSKTPFVSIKLNQLLAPAALGSGYAISKILTLRCLDSIFALEQNFNMILLGGFVLGLAMRPIVQGIYWSPALGFCMCLGWLSIIGPLGQSLERITMGISLDQEFWFYMIPELTASLSVALLVGLLMPPSFNRLGFSKCWQAIKPCFSPAGSLKWVLGGGLYVLLFLVFSVAFNPGYVGLRPMARLNTYFDATDYSLLQLCSLLWLRGVICIGIMLPMIRVLKGKPTLFALMLGAAFFVIAEVTPAFGNLQSIAPYLLIQPMIPKFFLDFLFCMSIVFLFSPLSSLKYDTFFIRKSISAKKLI